MPPREVETWLQARTAVGSDPDQDLEYEPEFLALSQASLGRPETQFAPAEPPAWQPALDMAEDLMSRTHDLRVAMLWCRAAVRLDGLTALPAALALLQGLLSRCWDTLHPRPDAGGDVFMRQAVLSGMDSAAGLAGDLRHAPLLPDQRSGGLTFRDCEVAVDGLSPRSDETPATPVQITGLLQDMPEQALALERCLEDSLQALLLLDDTLRDRFGLLDQPETANLRAMLLAARSLLPESPGGLTEAAATGLPQVPAEETVAAGPMRIESRQDVLRALQLACVYLDRHEPTNPAQWLLRRATQLIGLDFVQLVRILASDGSAQVEQLFGSAPAVAGLDDPFAADQ